MSFLSERTATNLQALLVFAAYGVLLIVAPHQWLRPLSVVVVAFTVVVVVGARAYLRRLEEVAGFLAIHSSAPPGPQLVALLTRPERTLLRLSSGGTAAEVIQRIRRRQAALTSAAMCLALPGICAFLLALFLFSN